MSFTVAIVGRPNVGKSTLFNRLTGKRHALVDDMPGVTRDWRMGDAHIADLEFRVIDTAGLEEADEDTLQARMTRQTEQAIAEADVTMMVIDGRAGVMPDDEHFAKVVRKLKKPMILVVNKAEGGKANVALADAYRLGLGEPVAISAEHGEGMQELYHALAPFASEDEAGDKEDINTVMQIAIVGRPNVGKSTLLNRILGEERVLTGPEAGITRDAIAVEYMFEGKPLKLIDTAGMRKKSNVISKLEKLSVADSLRSIQYAHVVVMVIDAQAPLEKQDNAIASLIEQEGRAMVLAVNKWDTVDDPQAYLKAIYQRLEKVLPQVKGIPVVPISGKSGYNLSKLMKECFRVYKLWNTEITTGQLNRFLEAATSEHTPPMVSGRRIKLRYMVQKSARPPSFILFSNTSDVPEHYMRYLINVMRERFDLPAVPIRMRIRKNKNPYSEMSEE